MSKLADKIISYLSGCALSYLLLLPGIAQAQIKIEPLVIETNSQRGQATGVITVTNPSEETFRARVYALPFTYDKDGFEVLESSPNDLTPYLVFSPRELVVEPGQSRRIRVVSRLLPSMTQGEYRAVIFTEPLQEITESSGVGIIPRIGVTMYVRHGDVSPELRIEGANYDPKSHQIQLLVSNSGDATARPKIASWQLSQNGTAIKTGETEAFTVIAEGERYLLIPYPANRENVSPGNYQLTGSLIWGDSNNPDELPFSVDLTISPEDAAAANQPREEQQQ